MPGKKTVKQRCKLCGHWPNSVGECRCCCTQDLETDGMLQWMNDKAKDAKEMYEINMYLRKHPEELQRILGLIKQEKEKNNAVSQSKFLVDIDLIKKI